jgi:ABC-type multidrug transport system fused ATPase/permease subunit
MIYCILIILSLSHNYFILWPNYQTLLKKKEVFFRHCILYLENLSEDLKNIQLIRYATASISAMFVVAQFGAFGIIVNEFVKNGIQGADPITLLKGFILLLVTQFGPDLITIVHDYAWNVQGNDLSRHLQSLRFLKMQDLDIGTIEQPEFQNIYEISGNRGWSSFYQVVHLFTTALRYITTVTVSSLAILAISPIAFLIIFIGALPTYFVERKNAILSAKIHKESSEQWRMWQAKTNAISHKDGLTELKNYSLINIFRKKFLDIIGDVHAKLKKSYHKKLINAYLAQMILIISYGIVFGLLIYYVYTEKLAVGSLVFAFGIVTQFQLALNSLFNIFGRMTEHKKNVDVFLDFLEMEPLIIPGTKKIQPDEFEVIDIKNVSFNYPGSDKVVLNNLNLKISKGDNLAIVGLNGAGKSTLLKLITRVYDPVVGEILINNVNLKQYDLNAWKRCLAILLQEYELYSEETIAENIMLGDTTKHDQDLVEKSAIDSTADDFIQELKNKYDQKIGTEFRGGVELSKGQKQKTVLARALYRTAPIVILDEPTASVDALSEDRIFKSLKNNHNNQTRVIISHKFSNVRDADKIILIEHGTIIEQGSHDELMKLEKGRYRELFELQAEGYK